MKNILTVSLFAFFSTLSIAATDPSSVSELLLGDTAPMASVLDGSCEQYWPCPDGQNTAYCKATGPYTRCHKWGDNGVRCVAWNSAGKSTVASQVCP